MDVPSYGITPGQAPAATQVNLGAFTGPLNNELQAGQLRGGPAYTGTSGALGKGNLGMINGIANSRMLQVALQQKMDALKQQEQQDQFNSNQPGIMDFLGLGVSGAGAVSGINAKNNMAKLMQQMTPQDQMAQWGDMLNNPMTDYFTGG